MGQAFADIQFAKLVLQVIFNVLLYGQEVVAPPENIFNIFASENEVYNIY